MLLRAPVRLSFSFFDTDGCIVARKDKVMSMRYYKRLTMSQAIQTNLFRKYKRGIGTVLDVTAGCTTVATSALGIGVKDIQKNTIPRKALAPVI